MHRTVVRYKIKADRADENARLVKDVFAELQAKALPGVRYAAFRLPDGSFIHVSEAEGETSPIPQLDAFKRFIADIKDRALEKPHGMDVTIVGNYRMLSD